MTARNSSIVGGAGTAGPGEGRVGFSAEGADVGAFILWVIAFAALALDVVSDTNFAIVGGAESAIRELRPCIVAVLAESACGVPTRLRHISCST